MFYDTIDYFTDSKKTKEIKANRRRSNYYEKKRDRILDHLQYINNRLSDIETQYNLLAMQIESEADDVMDCAYYKAITNMLKKSDNIIRKLKAKRDIVQVRHTRASDLQIYFYQRG